MKVYLKHISKLLLVVLIFVVSVIIFFYFIYKVGTSSNCNNLERLANDESFIQRMRSGVELISKRHELKFNLFMTSQLDSDEFGLFNIDWSSYGLNTSRVGIRLNAPRGEYQKTLDKIESISLLNGRCCILKIPMFNRLGSTLELSESEKKFQKEIKNPNVYLSCDFELLNR